MRVSSLALGSLLLVAVAITALLFAAERGEALDFFPPLGLLMPIGLLAGFLAFYRREQRLRPDLDGSDEDDQSKLLGATIIKFGCLLFVVASLSALFFALVLGR